MPQEKPKQDSRMPRILRWRGLLAGYGLSLRLALAVIVILTSGVLAFTQLGFVGVGLPDGSSGYIVVLLLVVALGALLLGTFLGTVIGVASGAILYVHAQFLPLNHYEMLYVIPETSIVMLGVAGFSLGVLFAFVLRNNPSKARRFIYIAIVCCLVSWFYSLFFGINVFISLVVSISESMGSSVDEAIVAEMARTTAARLGSLPFQAWGTALLMMLVCWIADAIVNKIIAHEGPFHLRTLFNAGVGVAVLLTFMAMEAASFIVTTNDEIRAAETNMRSDINYLADQLQTDHAKSQSFLALMESVGVDMMQMDDDELDLLLQAIAAENPLESFSVEEHGTGIITLGSIIDRSNNEDFPDSELISEVFSSDMTAAVEKSLETDHIQRFVYDGPKWLTSNNDSLFDQRGQPYIAYLMAKQVIHENSDGDTFEQNVIIMQDSEQVFKSRAAVMEWTTLSSLALMLIVSGVVFLLLNLLVARRIDEDNEALERITAGNLDARATAGGTVELESLTDGINKTVDALKGWIAEAETRMDAELATAKAIQESALPRIFPPYPNNLHFDIYASMQPARQVGGDFYDFFLIGDDSDADTGKLGFVVADVSGKGVPAALFMMKAKALIRDYAASGMELGEAVAEANHQICDGNDAGMFVTAWVGVLDYGTGHVDYVNAGHNPPLLWSFLGSDDQESGGGLASWRWLSNRSGLPLGLFDGMPYTAYSLECKPGDTFLLYSDGVTESMDVNGGLYGEERLMALASKHYTKHPRELLEVVRKDVALHARGAEQSDDITILALEYGVPPEVTAVLEVPAEVSQLDAINEFLHAELERRLCPRRVQMQLDLVVEELFVNVCRYAYPDAKQGLPGNLRVHRTYSADPPSVVVEFIDQGVEFDPLAKPDVELPDNIEDMAIGGLGIFLVKQFVDEIRYERIDGRNITTIVKKW